MQRDRSPATSERVRLAELLGNSSRWRDLALGSQLVGLGVFIGGAGLIYVLIAGLIILCGYVLLKRDRGSITDDPVAPIPLSPMHPARAVCGVPPLMEEAERELPAGRFSGREKAADAGGGPRRN